jgi:predicted O-methyltransferase YrrM
VGYSTVWLAIAAEETDGCVTSCEWDEATLVTASSNLLAANLLHRVQLKHGEAIDFLSKQTGVWDFAFIDLWKGFYLPCFDTLVDEMAPRAMVVADNMLEPSELRALAAQYQARVRGEPGWRSIALDVGNGLEVSWRPADWFDIELR